MHIQAYCQASDCCGCCCCSCAWYLGGSTSIHAHQRLCHQLSSSPIGSGSHAPNCSALARNWGRGFTDWHSLVGLNWAVPRFLNESFVPAARHQWLVASTVDSSISAAAQPARSFRVLTDPAARYAISTEKLWDSRLSHSHLHNSVIILRILTTC